MATDHKARNLMKGLEAVLNKRTFAKITRGLKEPTAGTTPRRKAAWVREVVQRMDRELTKEQCRQVMEHCACHVRPQGPRKDRKLWQQCDTLEDFARAYRDRGWRGFLAKGNALHVNISEGWCHCGLVRGRQQEISKTYCLCCAEHLRHGFEPVFGPPMKVYPTSTVISGDGECRFTMEIGALARSGARPR
jgi:hypothetical protein